MKYQKTIYKGIEFKSALEARWAKQFDDADLVWEYEPNKRISKNGSAYTFDFVVRLGLRRLFIEVKPSWEVWLAAKKQKAAMWQVMQEMLCDINNAFVLIYCYPHEGLARQNLFQTPITELILHDFGMKIQESFNGRVVNWVFRNNNQTKKLPVSSLERLRHQYNKN